MEFTTPDVVKIIDVNRNRLQVWLDKGWIVPSIQKAKGYGGRNLFSKADIYRISLFKWLVESGLSRGLIGTMFQALGKYDFGKMVKKTLTTKKKYYWFNFCRHDIGIPYLSFQVRHSPIEQKNQNLDNVRYIFSINITKIVDEVDQNIKKMDYQEKEAQKQGK